MTDKDRKALPEAVTELLLDAVAPTHPGDDAASRIRNRIFDRIASDKSEPQLVTVPGSGGDWFEPVPGNTVKILRQDEESMSILVRLEPGTVFPAHSHPADEETYVLEGKTRFGDIELEAGDYHLAPKGSHHGEVTTETGCLLLIRKSSQD